jgi:hypothetical protein
MVDLLLFCSQGYSEKQTGVVGQICANSKSPMKWVMLFGEESLQKETLQEENLWPLIPVQQ